MSLSGQPLNAPGWFRCYLPGCDGSKRTDDTWAHHYSSQHKGTDANVIRKPGGCDMIEPPEPKGREAFLRERDRRRRANT